VLEQQDRTILRYSQSKIIHVNLLAKLQSDRGASQRVKSKLLKRKFHWGYGYTEKRSKAQPFIERISISENFLDWYNTGASYR
jgi:hypothetical protein